MNKKELKAVSHLAEALQQTSYRNQVPIGRKLAVAWINSRKIKWYLRFRVSIKYIRAQSALDRAIATYGKDLKKRDILRRRAELEQAARELALGRWLEGA